MTNALVKVNTSKPVATSQDWDAFDEFVEATKKSVAKTSKRVYAQTFNAWASWCETNNVSPLDMRLPNATKFVESGNTTKETRGRQISILRKFNRMGYAITGNENFKRMYDALMLVKVQSDGAGHERARRALQPHEVEKILAVWRVEPKDNKRFLIHHRNRAMVALIFATGLRRSEAAALKWEDINLTDGILKVRHGKGDKEREVSIVGEFAITALSDWLKISGDDRIYAFPPVTKSKIAKDTAVDSEAVYRAVKHTEMVSGVKFSPHDARRTVATELLEDSPLSDVQAQLGHSQPQTTLRYSYAADAKKRRLTFKLKYGK